MSLADIENQLHGLKAEELRRLALKSWTAFLAKEDHSDVAHECSEDDPELLAAFDLAIEQADGSSQTYEAAEVRSRLKQWTSK